MIRRWMKFPEENSYAGEIFYNISSFWFLNYVILKTESITGLPAVWVTYSIDSH